MNKCSEWLLLILLALAGIFLWCRFSLPRYQSIDLSVSQSKAIDISKKFLEKQYGVGIRGYKTVLLFNVDEDTDRYLQKTLGIAASQQLIYDQHYDLFFWVVRFFKEKQKEEFKVAVSCATGEVIGMGHTIPDTALRPAVDKEKAREMAFDFLQKTYGFDPSQYYVHSEEIRKYDNRQDYAFSWQ
jgi:hypothetical protein